MRIWLMTFGALLLLAGCQTASRTDHTGGRAGAYIPPAPTRPAVPIAPSPSGTAPVAPAEAYMDKQEQLLRSGLRGSGILVARQGNNIVLNIGSDLLFSANSTVLSAAAAARVRSISDILRYYDRSMVEVDGYTDTTGTPEKNLQLSQRRADVVGAALKSGGVSAKRIFMRGFGETKLKIPTPDNVSEPRNRRVEIHIMPSVV